MRTGFRFLVASVCVLVLSGWVAGVAVAPTATAGELPIVPASTGTSPKVHLMEVFTGVWCGPCGIADPGISRLSDEWRDNLIVIAYHCCYTSPPTGNYDPFFNSATTNRDTFYGWGYLPTVVYDGGGATYGNDNPIWIIGGGGTSATSYDRFRIPLEDYTDSSSNIAISIDGDLTPTAATAYISITATDPVPETNLRVRTVLYEDALFFPQNSGPDFHRNVARAINDQPLTISQGQTVALTASFPMDSIYEPSNLGVAVFVQSNDRRTFQITGYPQTWYASDVLNAAKHDFTPQGIMLHRDRGTVADYNEVYEQVMSPQNESFEAWNTYTLGMETGTSDPRNVPDAGTLAESPLLIWHTGTESTNVLDAAERTAIQDYLSSGGSVLITGSDLGFDAWTVYRSWFQTYLHATYTGDDSGATFVNGVGGDPIGNPYAGTNLNVLGDPDQIDVFGSDAWVPFRYPGNVPASVRAVHDTDSRVVYLGFQYFENTIDPMRGAVMTSIIDWMDGASPPKVDVLYPDGGEQINPGANVDIRWHASDVRIPANGVDVYFNSNYPSGGWTPVAQNQPNDGLYKWTLPSVNSGSCRIRVVARDSSPESADGTGESAGDFICGNPYFEITFGPSDVGTKRLISFPRVVSDTTVTAVLASLSGSYGVARWYDPNDAADPWKAYYPTKGNGDLLYIDNTVGFWIEVTAPGTLRISGSLPSSPTIIGLKQGWNLVGFPSMNPGYTVAMLKAATGATRVEGYLATAGPYYLQVLSNPTLMAAGEGYWVHCPSDAIWSVPL